MFSSSRPTVDEMELWPNLTWRMAALLKSGCPASAVFERLLVDLPKAEIPADLLQRILSSSERCAFQQACGDIRLVLRRCRHYARHGFSISAALESVLASPDHVTELNREYSTQRIAEMAACWRVSERTGAPIAVVLERLARFYESEIDLYQARDSAMSGPKATAHILSWLPLLGLGLGVVMGTNPLGLLFGSILGALIAVVGLSLALWGRLWTARLVSLAERGQL